MRVVLLGASGRTGAEALERLVSAGHEVTSLGRTAPARPGARHVAGDVADPAAMARAVAGHDAVISCLASSNAQPVCSRATAAVIAAAAGRPLRYVVVGGAGVDVPGDAKGLPDRLVGLAMRVLVGRMLADRQAEHDALAASGLAYTFLRPPRLTQGPATGRWRFTFDRPAGMQIARADLAGALVEALGRADLERRSPFVAAG
jgi:putative NADH-flavin reductase